MSIRIREIQQEMQQEAKIDKAINNIVKRLLKQNQNRKYRIVSTRKEASALLIFIRSQLSSYSFVLNEENNETLDRYEHDDRITIIFLKNKNPHDSKNATRGDINKNASAKKFVTSKTKYI